MEAGVRDRGSPHSVPADGFSSTLAAIGRQAQQRSPMGGEIPGPLGTATNSHFRSSSRRQGILSTVEADVLRGAWVNPAGARRRFDSWVDEWWSTTSHLRPTTRVRDRGYLDRYVLPTFGTCHLGAITQTDVRSWVSQLTSRGLAPSTVRLAYGLLAKVIRAAVDSGLIGATPCRNVPLAKVEPRGDAVPLTGGS